VGVFAAPLFETVLKIKRKGRRSRVVVQARAANDDINCRTTCHDKMYRIFRWVLILATSWCWTMSFRSQKCRATNIFDEFIRKERRSQIDRAWSEFEFESVGTKCLSFQGFSDIREERRIEEFVVNFRDSGGVLNRSLGSLRFQDHQTV